GQRARRRVPRSLLSAAAPGANGPVDACRTRPHGALRNALVLPMTWAHRPSSRRSTRSPMAKRTKTLVGLDIDATGIVAASATVNGRVRVERAIALPLEPGIVRDGEVVDVEGLTTALRTLYRENKGLEKRVRVGLANQKIVVRVVDLPYLEDQGEIDAAVRFHAQDQLPMPLDQAVLDYQALDVVTDETGRRQRVLLVAARREMVERVLAALRGAGLKPEGIDLSAFAMVRALHRAGLEEEQVLYLAIGGLTNLAVARGTNCTFAR